jgi:hypothetical protein
VQASCDRVVSGKHLTFISGFPLEMICNDQQHTGAKKTDTIFLHSTNLARATTSSKQLKVVASAYAYIRFLSLFAFGLSAKLMPKALELLFPHPPHPPLLLIFSFKWLPMSHKMTNDTWHYLLSTF